MFYSEAIHAKAIAKPSAKAIANASAKVLDKWDLMNHKYNFVAFQRKGVAHV